MFDWIKIGNIIYVYSVLDVLTLQCLILENKMLVFIWNKSHCTVCKYVIYSLFIFR